jgi:hypothetical protein
VQELSAADAADLIVWEEVEATDGGRLYRLTDTPYGVDRLEWSPDGRALWIQPATGEPETMGHLPTVSLIVGGDDHRVWTPNVLGVSGARLVAGRQQAGF